MAHADIDERIESYPHSWSGIAAEVNTEDRLNLQNKILNSINQIYEIDIRCETIKDFGQACLSVIEQVTGSMFSFIGEIGEDGLFQDIVISDPGWDRCQMIDKTGHGSAPGNYRIHGLFGKVLLKARSVLVNDPSSYGDSIGLPEGYPQLSAFLGVPMLRCGKVVGMIGVGNREGGYRQEELEILESLTSPILEVILRKRAEIELNKAKNLAETLVDSLGKQLNAILENLVEGVMVTDAKGNILSMNPTALRMHGFNSLEEFKTFEDFTNVFEVLDLDGIPIELCDFAKARALRGEIFNDYEMCVYRKDIGLKWIGSYSGAPIYDKNGEMIMTILTLRDITERKRMEEELKIQKKQLEAIIDNIYEAVYIVDRSGNNILLNEAAKQMLSQGKIINKHEKPSYSGGYDLPGKEQIGKDISLTKLLNGESISNEITIEHEPNKRYICSNARPIFDDHGNFIMGVMSSRDVTNDVLYQQSLERQVEMLNNLIDNLDLPVIRLSYPDLSIKDINQKRYSVQQAINPEIKSSADIIGKYYMDVIIDKDDSEDILNCIRNEITEKKAPQVKQQKWIVLGQEMYVNTLLQPIFNRGGDIEEIVCVSFDITSEVNSNTQMQMALKIQEEFFANISHELKTPLNVIYAAIQLFNMYFEKGSLDEKKDTVKNYVNVITQNCYRLSKLINNIVDISKIEAGFYELNLFNNNIVEIVEEIVMSVRDYTESKELQIIFDTEFEEKILACDPEKIERIMLNLISNAIKFTEQGGKINVNIREKDEFVEISVCDNGIGIDSNNLSLIFDRFKQVDKSLSRNVEGTGIGLSLVKLLVELHGGRINVKSKFGKGSEFIVMLPLKRVMQENMMLSDKMRNKNENIKVEFSDIYS